LTKLYPDVTLENVDQLAEDAEFCTYYAGETLIEEGDELEHVYVVRRGKVDLLVEAEEHPLSIKGHQGMFLLGEVELVTGQLAAVTVVAVEPTTVYRLEKGYFDQVLRTNPGVCYSILTEACKKVFSRVESYRLPKWPIDQQVATVLNELVTTKRFPTKVTESNVVEIAIRQKELASRMGLRQSSVYRALKVLKAHGVVLNQKRGGLVLDGSALKSYS